MDFHAELVAKLTNPKKQKPYKESSVKPVWGYLKSLNGGIAPTSLDYLLDRPMVMRFLEKYAVNTQRTIVFALRNIAKDFDRDDILEVWKENIEETEAGKGLPPKGEKSEAQQKAYALVEGDDKGSAWDSVLKKVEEFKGSTRDKTIGRLYTMFPPRRNLDYTEMKLCDDYKPDLSKEFNYLVVELRNKKKTDEDDYIDVEFKGKMYVVENRDRVYERTAEDVEKYVGNVGMLYFADMKLPARRKILVIHMKFVFNRYKTDGVYSQQVFDVPNDLVAVLKSYITEYEVKDGDFLLRNKMGGHLRSDDITDVLHKVIGSGVSTQMLRHMYVDKYNSPERQKVIHEMMGDAVKMSHSISMQQNTYVKN
jgi:hypothetical protein